MIDGRNAIVKDSSDFTKRIMMLLPFLNKRAVLLLVLRSEDASVFGVY